LSFCLFWATRVLSLMASPDFSQILNGVFESVQLGASAIQVLSFWIRLDRQPACSSVAT
jgi:hypothetical protein